MAATFRLPPLMGHRGAALSAPENTLAGFRQAGRLGVPWVEFDIRLTADGVCVVHHDDTLERTTGATARVDAMPLGAISSLDAGAWFGASFAGQAPPSLENALAYIAELDLGANIELKTCPAGREDDMAEAVAIALARSWPPDRIDIMASSFDVPLLAALERHLPELPRALIARRLPRPWASRSRRLGCAALHLNHEAVTAALAGRIKDQGFGLAVWSVDDPARATALWDMGVDCIISSASDRIKAAWEKRPQSGAGP